MNYYNISKIDEYRLSLEYIHKSSNDVLLKQIRALNNGEEELEGEKTNFFDTDEIDSTTDVITDNISQLYE